MNIAVIPARGGSKRIPKKNIRPFCGKPIIAYSIEAARKTGLFEHIIVSTDSLEISETAIRYGAEVPFMRPAALADDFTGTDAVTLHTIQWVQDNWGPVDYVCCLYATAPFVEPVYLKAGFDLLQEKEAVFSFAVTTFPFPIFRAFKVRENGRPVMFWPENENTRSQDLPEAYHDAGQFYWATASAYLKNNAFITSDAAAVILPRYLVQDIDTMEDWETAERMYTAMTAKTVNGNKPLL